LYLNRRCQLACQYCFSDLPEVTDFAEVSVDTACVAANLVANNCAEENLPLVVVFHGGGEPVLSWRLVDALQPELRRIADAHGIPLFRYIATNGVMSEQRAHWLARSFDLVGLSIDGPPEIQLVQRPYRNSNQDNTLIILRTARILREAGVPVHIRVTLTAESALQQMEICQYLCKNISPSAISVEPVYRGGRANASMQIREEQLDGFVKSFFEARAEARRREADWRMSGARSRCRSSQAYRRAWTFARFGG
jgi:sulfatase maturation enzyme AslB (radical SAM superfamily)